MSAKFNVQVIFFIKLDDFFTIGLYLNPIPVFFIVDSNIASYFDTVFCFYIIVINSNWVVVIKKVTLIDSYVFTDVYLLVW
ncbi:hypothetical protein SEEACDC1_04455 [Salmonella enterica subsp. enterica serovar Agona str. SA-1]|nr:hypothetical protein SEEA6721_19497 [Salmonella enterica subsp. enterica serovar Agona str. 447967 2-1]ESB21340.1 hypothetical protein SEEA6711_16730 [Salmonella enterica subsp. enterica serovar Agona str. 447967 1-1]ESB74242.1 hypothetical protein SEEACDC4_20681 [Salmonella enterica subsp. enterica serovar Agona str. SA-4]ESC28875.1 hypothetical protein SEEACDC1_04455 [Salmonella enterica subsp. enterica serovar Agona str. SA-1]ESC34015.1 hypothetical protein SEEACDC2_03862 [Salmonella ente